MLVSDSFSSFVIDIVRLALNQATRNASMDMEMWNRKPGSLANEILGGNALLMFGGLHIMSWSRLGRIGESRVIPALFLHDGAFR